MSRTRTRTLAAITLALLGWACGCAEETRAVRVERVERIELDSPAMGGRWPAVVILPAEYARSPHKRFPVIYLLHGAGGDHWSWLRGAPLARLLESRAVIFVCVNGRQFGWYVDSERVKNSNVETHITKELIPFIDARYRTNGRRAVAGFSMGGHGAITLTAKHPELFVSASSLSGILDLTRWGGQWGLGGVFGPLGRNRARWRAASAMGLVDRFTATPRPLLIDCGKDDFAIEDNRRFHRALTARGIEHVYVEKPGAHDWHYWPARLPDHLDFHLAVLAQSYLPASSPPAAATGSKPMTHK